MLPISAAQRETFFPPEVQDLQYWIGTPLTVFARAEWIPFKFFDEKYVMLFEHPADSVGGEEHLPAHMEAFSKDFTIDPDSRLMKFMHVDSTYANAYDPSHWHLPHKGYMFQFLGMLREVVEVHVDRNPHLTQYFYCPASEKLKSCYTRAYRKLSEDCNLSKFEPISAPLGDFYGFQRKKFG